jgi:hypothetical protein
MGSAASGDRFYIRYRGQVTGPFALDELARRVRRNALGRAHELSRDAVNWSPATVMPGLFNSDVHLAKEIPETVPPAEVAPVPTRSPDAAKRPQWDTGMFYRVASQTLGPVALEFLEASARDGSLPADAVVWADGDSHSYPASSHPLLADLPWPAGGVSSAGGDRASGAKLFGCGTMLIIVAVLLLAGGVITAIKMASTSNDKSDKSDNDKPRVVAPPSLPGSQQQQQPPPG